MGEIYSNNIKVSNNAGQTTFRVTAINTDAGEIVKEGNEVMKAFQHAFKKANISNSAPTVDESRTYTTMSIQADTQLTTQQLQEIAREMEKELKEPVRLVKNNNLGMDVPFKNNRPEYMFSTEGMEIVAQGPMADEKFGKLWNAQSSSISTPPLSTPMPNIGGATSWEAAKKNVAAADTNGDKKLDTKELQALADKIGAPIKIYNNNNQAGSSININGEDVFVGTTDNIKFDSRVQQGQFTLHPLKTPNNPDSSKELIR